MSKVGQLSQEERIRSRWWYLLPIFFQIIGGVIAYFILRNDDPKKAKNCLWLGITLTAIKIGLFVVFISICTSIGACAEFHDEFMSGMRESIGQEDLMQDPQQMQRMMQDQHMMQQMMQDPQQREQMMNMMMQNPEFMEELMGNPEFMQRMMNP